MHENEDYWNNTDNIPIEVFAHFFSAFTANKESFGVLTRYLPHAKAMFDDMVCTI